MAGRSEGRAKTNQDSYFAYTSLPGEEDLVYSQSSMAMDWKVIEYQTSSFQIYSVFLINPDIFQVKRSQSDD